MLSEQINKQIKDSLQDLAISVTKFITAGCIFGCAKKREKEKKNVVFDKIEFLEE